MPTYQYECEACDHTFEILQSMLDEKLKKCPKCDKNKLNRLIGAGSGIIFKGSGFYETDYKKKEPSKSALKSGSTETSPGITKSGAGEKVSSGKEAVGKGTKQAA